LKVRGPLNLNQTGVLESIAGPLDEEEMARVRRIGKHIYGKKKG
jgi:hypothetical protein